MALKMNLLCWDLRRDLMISSLVRFMSELEMTFLNLRSVLDWNRLLLRRDLLWSTLLLLNKGVISIGLSE
jgi:hypothetical protein